MLQTNLAIMKFGPGAVEDPFVKEKQFHDHHREGGCSECQRETLLHCFWVAAQRSV